MKTYNIYNTQTDEFLGTVVAKSIEEAEIKGQGLTTVTHINDIGYVPNVYALTKEDK